MNPAPKVLVTRARDDAGPLCAALEAAGFSPVLLPLLAYERTAGAAQVRDALAGLGQGHVALTSARAVPSLAELSPLPAGVKVAAVGPATAARLAEAGIAVDVLGDGDGAAGLVRAFARLEAPEGGTGRVLWLAGNLSSDELRFGLKGLGYEVSVLEVYRTVDLQPTADELDAALDGLAAAVFASPSAVRSFVSVAGEAWITGPGAQLATVAIGPTTEGELVRAGFRRRRVAAETSPEGIVRAVAAALAEIP